MMFASMARSEPDRIWSATLGEKERKAISEYSSRKRLSSGKTYGDSVRGYDLRNKCVSDIDREMHALGCTRNINVLKNPKTQNPLLTSQGQTIPLIVFICPDGGVVRLKPVGDPTGTFRTQPLASKALRYPFNSKFENFDDEIVKIDNFGNAIPKWAHDLNPSLNLEDHSVDWVAAWADDAHTDLKLDCSS